MNNIIVKPEGIKFQGSNQDGHQGVEKDLQCLENTMTHPQLLPAMI